MVHGKADIPRQLGQQVHFFVVKEPGFVGKQGDHADHLVRHQQGQHGHRRHAARSQLLGDQDARIVLNVLTHHGLPGAHHAGAQAFPHCRGLAQPQPAPHMHEQLCPGPGERRRHHLLQRVVHATDPGDLELAVLHSDAAGLAEQLVALAHTHDQGVDAAEHGIHAVQPLDAPLGVAARRDVLTQGCHPRYLPAHGAQHRVVPVHQAPLAGPGQDLVVVVPGRRPVGQHVGKDAAHIAQLGRHEQLEPVAAKYLVTLPARQPQQIVVAVGDAAFAVQHQRDHFDLVEHVVEAAVAFVQFLFGALFLGDVLDGVEPAAQLAPACVFLQRFRHLAQIQRLAVATHNAVSDVHAYALVRGLQRVAAEHVAIVRVHQRQPVADRARHGAFVQPQHVWQGVQPALKGAVGPADDVGNPGQRLGPAQGGLVGAQGIHSPLTLLHLHLQLLGVLLDLLIQAAVFVDAADLRAQDGQDFLVVGAEGVRPLLVGQTQPAVGERQRHDGRDQRRVQRGIARGQANRRRVAPRIDQALRAAFGPQLAQEPVRHHGQINRPVLQGRVHATGADDDTVAVLAHRAQHGVLRAHQFAGATAHIGQQHLRVALGGQLQVQVRQRGQAPVHGCQFGHVVGELVRHQLQVAGLEAVLQRYRRLVANLLQCLLDGRQDVLRLAGLEKHLGHTTGLGQAQGLFLEVMRAAKDHLRRRQAIVGAQLPHELKAVHGRHQDVGDHQVRPLGTDQGQRLGAIGRLQRLVAAVPDERDHKRAVGGEVINDEDLCHAVSAGVQPDGGSVCRALAKKDSICCTKVSGAMGLDRCSLKPISRAFSRSPRIEKAVTATSGTTRQRGLDRRPRATS